MMEFEGKPLEHCNEAELRAAFDAIGSMAEQFAGRPDFEAFQQAYERRVLQELLKFQDTQLAPF